MLDLALDRRDEVAFPVEDGDVEVVVVVGHQHLTTGSDVHPDGEVGDALASNLSQAIAVVIKHLCAWRGHRNNGARSLMKVAKR